MLVAISTTVQKEQKEKERKQYNDKDYVKDQQKIIIKNICDAYEKEIKTMGNIIN